MQVMNSLTRKVIMNWGTRFVVLSALLFVPAHSLAFPRAWAFLAVYFLPQTLMIGYFLRTDPAFVERRLKMGPGAEARTRQKLVMVLMILSSFLDEEEFLRANLSGYPDYCQKVPHRLIPAIWYMKGQRNLEPAWHLSASS